LLPAGIEIGKREREFIDYRTSATTYWRASCGDECVPASSIDTYNNVKCVRELQILVVPKTP
jgi:hypothetical protein